MERKDVEKTFYCGKVLHEFSKNKIFLLCLRTIYTLIGIWALHTAWHTTSDSERIITYMIFSLIIWRFYCTGQSLIFLCERGVVVKIKPNNIEERIKTLFNNNSLYFHFTYDKIVGFNERWDGLYIGTVEVGGIYTVPVDLQYLNYKDKVFIEEFIAKYKGDSEMDNEKDIKNKNA